VVFASPALQVAVALPSFQGPSFLVLSLTVGFHRAYLRGRRAKLTWLTPIIGWRRVDETEQCTVFQAAGLVCPSLTVSARRPLRCLHIPA